MTKDIGKYERQFDAVGSMLGKGKSGKDGNEGLYAALYQKLVQLGARPQLRLKYRQQS